MTEDDYLRAAWSAAMTDVADEMQAEMANLPPAERRVAAQPISALNATVNDLTNLRTAWSMIILGGTPTGCESCDQVVHGLKTSAAR
jgi:hypothetical protein